MPLASVIRFNGAPDDVIWQYPEQDFNTMSQLEVEDTHIAVLVVNGQAADTFGAGRHTLSVPNIPILKKLISIPTGGVNPFRCKIFFISKLHQMDMLWGTPEDAGITLNDPLYDIFLHVRLRGSMSISLREDEARKTLLKLSGFGRQSFKAKELVQNFRGLIVSHVKDSISKIMIRGQVSYFMISAELFDISSAIKERLDPVFAEYGVSIEYFNIEAIEVPDQDYRAVKEAKERKAGRLIEGYTWQQEREMMIAEKFAGNEGTMGAMGGLVGGLAIGGAFAGSMGDLARKVLNQSSSISNMANPDPAAAATNTGMNVLDFLKNDNGTVNVQAPNTPAAPEQTEAPAPQPEPPVAPAPAPQQDAPANACVNCGKPLVEGAMFCAFCGTQQPKENKCPNCGKTLSDNFPFCPFCGTAL